MKTVGGILKEGREAKGISLEKLSAITRIDVAYIKDIEEGNFKKLPSATFAKGFIRNLAQVLDKNPDEMVAIFRRDYQETQKSSPKTRPRKIFISAKSFHSQTILLIFGALIFLIYLGFQYRAVVTPPKLSIESPTSEAIVVSPVNIVGQTDPGTTVVINEDLKTTTDSTGKFVTRLNLSPGQTEVKLSVTNRFGRTTIKIIPITVISQ